jgi:hypothetical protein
VESLPFVEIILNFISVFLGAVLYVCLMNNNELGKYKIKS